jgi:hypothetical protein
VCVQGLSGVDRSDVSKRKDTIFDIIGGRVDSDVEHFSTLRKDGITRTLRILSVFSVEIISGGCTTSG